MKTNFIYLITAAMLVLSIVSCNNKVEEQKSETVETEKISGDLIIFHAGSLSVPFKEIAEEFNKEYPEVNILTETAGSRKCARKITDLNKKCDIMASADYTVIDKLLIPDFADWNIKFASNEMAIVFHEDSKYAKEITGDNWYEILMKDDVIFGRSDPNADPCGYRAVLTTKLASKHYENPEIAEKLLNKNLNYIRPKETDLLALLESNTIDYIFLYRSVAEQHDLKFITLADEVNLKNPGLAEFYSSVTIEISGKKPGELISKKGEPMVYGITIVKDAPNYKAAEAFMNFVLAEDKGMAIMKKNGQPSMVPSTTETYNKIPETLKQFAKSN